MTSTRPDGLFREQALTEHEAGGRIEGLVRVTGPRYWMALVAVVVVLAGALVAATVARAPVTADGPAILVGPGGLGEVASPVAGVIGDLRVGVGDRVAPGRAVGSVIAADGTSVPVPSRVAGEVVEVVGRPGSAVPGGAVLMSVLPPGARGAAQVFVPAAEAAGLRPGLAVGVSPLAFPSSSFGAIPGVVRSVGSTAVSPAEVVALLGGNTALSAPIVSEGPAVRVDVRLDTAATPSGYAWTAGAGPEAAVPPVSLATGSIVIAPRRAIELLESS